MHQLHHRIAGHKLGHSVIDNDPDSFKKKKECHRSVISEASESGAVHNCCCHKAESSCNNCDQHRINCTSTFRFNNPNSKIWSNKNYTLCDKKNQVKHTNSVDLLHYCDKHYRIFYTFGIFVIVIYCLLHEFLFTNCILSSIKY